ncbi:glycosyltransferase family 1 protein [Trinickia caryophylli]|uniref:Glycosyltransferase involved in cell wall bisynthesis n=1 Tax=Trinickia caryophylli TaxID=28094 RepID=A0A1X7EBC2_TRICW|nr:glycosyltransferase family 1 protein [Trinickia caryophylli]PMS13088.1 glycosyltransferase family 1 protein [Trinickia caryophylli]TRX14712.1 glycosyltransferase family 1 protein [Trinickia caryophylli]WQE14555.1 glycosyltransferase family 1 protein [Trinickia caryophylli]SMF30873.1 Glycosyltransferase involved in cell wall bisynthesis [Trinickia caryophylli]GLU32035.1 transferase [Trinickia caryophylli]
MKIALVSEHASPLAVAGGVDSGGQNIYVANVARQLRRAGHQVDVFTRRDRALLPAVSDMDGVRVVHVPAGPPTQMPKEALLPYMPAFADFLLGFCRQERTLYDVIHANFFMSGLASLKAKDALGVPLVMTFHALGKVRRLHQGADDGFPDARFSIEERLVREADLVIAECPQDAADLREHYAMDPARIEIVPCGFDPAEFVPTDRAGARTALGWPSSQFAVLQLGRLVPRKGIDNVVRAHALLRQRENVDAHLYVVGGNADLPNEIATPEIARLRGVAATCGASEHVTFVGRRGRAQLREFYGAADVFVTTPWYEPFGITPIEAMACARPVVGADVGGIRYTVVDGKTGFLVPPRDPEALAERLARLAHDPALADRMGQAGHERAHAQFTWKGVAQQLEDVYRRVARVPADETVADETVAAETRRDRRAPEAASVRAAAGRG